MFHGLSVITLTEQCSQLEPHTVICKHCCRRQLQDHRKDRKEQEVALQQTVSQDKRKREEKTKKLQENVEQAHEVTSI